jgi:hypothetical protein
LYLLRRIQNIQNALAGSFEGVPSFGFTKIHPQKNFSNRKKFFSSLAFLPKKFFRFSNKKIGKSSALPRTQASAEVNRSIPIDQPASTYFFEPQKNMLRSLQHVKTLNELGAFKRAYKVYKK